VATLQILSTVRNASKWYILSKGVSNSTYMLTEIVSMMLTMMEVTGRFKCLHGRFFTHVLIARYIHVLETE